MLPGVLAIAGSEAQYIVRLVNLFIEPDYGGRPAASDLLKELGTSLM